MSANVDAWGRVVLEKDDIVELLYRGIEETQDILVVGTPETQQFNELCATYDQPESAFVVAQDLLESPDDFHKARQSDWLMPESYKELDIKSWLHGKCKTTEQTDRVTLELKLFEENAMLDVLRLFLYITDELKERNALWGVGRGSSVSSYCLFLIGIHRIDSLKYGLDIREFLREK